MRNLIFIVITGCIFCCCNYTGKTTNIDIECIDTYQQCDSIYQLDTTYFNHASNLLYARWKIRKGQYNDASIVLDSLEKLLSEHKNEKLYQQIILYKYLSQSFKFQLDIESLIEQLELNLDPAHNINMLYFLAKALRQKQEVNYAYSTSLYAEHLRSKLSQEKQKEIYYLPWSIHTITLIREVSDTSICKHYLKKTLEHCQIETPGCRYMRTLLLTLEENLSETEINFIKRTVLDSTQYIPTTEKSINTHLSYVASNDQYAIKSLLSELDHSKSICNRSNFYNTTYLIDAYLNTGNIKKAQLHLDSIMVCSKKNIQFNNLALYRKQALLYQKYTESKNKNTLIDLYHCSKELTQSYTAQGKSVINEHYADAIYKSNNIFLEALLELNKNKTIENIDVLNYLNEIKNLYNKISDSRSVLGNKTPGKHLQKINDLKFKIEKRELEVHRYLDTTYTDLGAYKELYHLHKELYQLKSELPEIKNYTSHNNKNIRLSEIDNETQIIDFIQSDSSFFLSKITSSEIQIKKLDRELVSEAIAQKKHQIKNKTITDKSNYLDQVITQEISKEHRKLIFIPDGDLFDFPIEAIKDNSGKHLVNEYSISYASQISEAINHSSIILGDRIFAVSYSSDATLNDRNIRTFPELVYGQEEIIAISESYPTKEIYSGYQLTEQNLTKGLKQDIVHISSHSKSSTNNPLDNYILIRDTKGNGVPIYGFTLKSMDWDTKLVILSSCDSGTGTIKAGAGIFSLSRDFLQSGAETVIKSLWKVNEKTTSELMVLFHQNIRKGLIATKALQQAKISLKSQPQYTHPYYWAGFILEGNANLKISN